MISTVIFDLDDTLYDEVDYCRSGLKAVAHFLDETMGRGQSTILFEAFWQEFVSGDRTTIFNGALTKLGIEFDEILIRSLLRVYRSHKPNLRLPPDSRKILKELQPNYQLALLTDGFLPAQRLKVQALGLQRWIPHIMYTEHLGRDHWKPSPLGFERLMVLLDCRAHEMVYVGDNATKDFIAPNRLGMGSIQIIRPSRLHKASPESKQASAQHVLEALSALSPLLAQWERRSKMVASVSSV